MNEVQRLNRLKGEQPRSSGQIYLEEFYEKVNNVKLNLFDKIFLAFNKDSIEEYKILKILGEMK